MKLDEFRSRRPIDILANTNPILIIDEPQSVEGAGDRTAVISG
jgi:type III restriction enzyme